MEEARQLAAKQREEALKVAAEEEARYKAELERMRLAAEEARQKAEDAAARAKAIEEQAERDRKAEEERLELERQRDLEARRAADFRRKDFSFVERLKQLGVTDKVADVRVEPRVVQGWMSKLGQVCCGRWGEGELQEILRTI